MACTAKQFVELLNSWVGRNEKDGTHKMIIDLYNSKVPRARNYRVTYKDSWCMAMMAAAAIKLAATDICPIECSCGEAIKIAQKMGIWIENENRVPNIGEWVVYDWDDDKKDFRITDNKGYPEHIGGVVEVNAANGVFKVVEGNFSDAVKVRTLAINGQYIRGFIAPKYATEPAAAPTTSTNKIVGIAVANESMKVRDGASTTNTKTVGFVSKGQAVEVLEVLSNGWYKIVWKGGVAYTSNANGTYYAYVAKGTDTNSAPTPAPSPSEGVKYKMKTLKRGSTGNQVTIFETIMKEMGYYKGSIDDDFGPKCEEACNAFQEDYPECGTDGKPDSIWGPDSWNKMFSLVGA